jgi:uncharacterized protein YsxB (DUF464 family)
LILTGHANEQVCSAASVLWHTMLLGYMALAKAYPKQISCQIVRKEKPARKR